MRRNGRRIRSAVAIIVVVALSTIGAFPLTARNASGQQQALVPHPYTVVVALAPGETARTWQYRIGWENFRDGSDWNSYFHQGFELTVLDGDPMIEVGVTIGGPMCPYPVINVTDILNQGNPGGQFPGSFRQTYIGQDRIDLKIIGMPNPTDYDFTPAEGTDISEYDCTVTIALSRRLDRCSVTATVNGDVGGAYFGDVAFFNTYDETVPIPLDPGTMSLLDSLLGMASPRLDPDNPGPVPQPSFADALAAWAAEDSEPSPTAGRFSLSATNVLFGDGDFGGGGMFSFTAIGPGVVDADEAVFIPLTHVAALPGALDRELDGVKFVWNQGEPGAATLQLWGMTETMLVGHLKATLFTERAYSPPGRRLQITLDARVLAQRGQLACQ